MSRSNATTRSAEGRFVGIRSLAEARPDYAAEWDFTKNGGLRPEDISSKSSKQVHWKCPRGPDHAWAATPAARRTCPFCYNIRASVTNCVATQAPWLVPEWHPQNALGPDEVPCGSTKTIRWKCPQGPDHEWQTACHLRAVQRHSCPFCAGKRASVTNSFLARFPELAKEWHPEKNAPVTPNAIVLAVSQKFWWRCRAGHEWRAGTEVRIRNPQCPTCHSGPSDPPAAALTEEETDSGGRDEPGKPLGGAHRFGVTRMRDCFHARVSLSGRTRHVGAWPTARQAAVARDRAVLYHGLELPLNYPKQSRRLGPASSADLVRQARLEKKKRRRHQSRFIGVSRDRHGGWAADVRGDGRTLHLGAFPTQLEAATAREQVALLKGTAPFSLNFPEQALVPAEVEDVRRKPAPKRIPKSREARGLVGMARSDRGWVADITQGDVKHPLGAWPTPKAAALAYDRAHLHFLGDVRRWRLNFPEEARKLGPADPQTLTAEARALFKQRTSSRFRGVTWDKRRGEWKASFQFELEVYTLGFFDSEEQAALTYDRRALEVLGDRARLNFHPETGEEILGRPFVRANSKSREPTGRRRPRKRAKATTRRK